MAVDIGAVHAAGDGLGVFRETLGCAGSDGSRKTIPFLRFDAPSRVTTAILPSAVSAESSFRRARRTEMESTLTGLAGIGEVVDPQSARDDRAQVGVLPTIHCSVGLELFLASASVRPPRAARPRCARRHRYGRDRESISDDRGHERYAPGRSATKPPSASIVAPTPLTAQRATADTRALA